MVAQRVNRRNAPRKKVTPIRVAYISSLENFSKIAKQCEIVQASATGLLVRIKRDSLIPQVLRRNLNLDMLIGTPIFMHLYDMNLEISGVIARTQLGGKKDFLVAIDYSEDAPEYWRECLTDLLPRPGEID